MNTENTTTPEYYFTISKTEDTQSATPHQVERIHQSGSLQALLLIWVKNTYTEGAGYFIDIWQSGNQDKPATPIADIKIEPWILHEAKKELQKGA